MDDRMDQATGKPVKSLHALATAESACRRSLLRIGDGNDKRAAYRDFVADLRAARIAANKSAAAKR
jgi:hypothetical protein